MTALRFILPILLCPLPLATAQDGKSPAPAPRSECALCRVPNRAALLAGTARKCPADCQKLCCAGAEVRYLVEGLVCDNCTAAVTAALARIPGVHVEAVCHNLGQALVKYDPAKVKPDTLVAAIEKAGHPVVGQRIEFPSDGVGTEARARNLEGLLAREAGVTHVHASPGPGGRITVVFDPAKTTAPAIAATVDALVSRAAAEH